MRGNYRIADEMWNTFGRTISESLIIDRIANGSARVTVDRSGDIVSDRNQARPTVYVGLHFGNWEATVIPAQREHAEKLIGIYKPLKNGRVNDWLLAQRAPFYSAGLLPTTRATVRGGY